MPVTMDAKKLIQNDKKTGGTVTVRASKMILNPSRGGKSGKITLRGTIHFIGTSQCGPCLKAAAGKGAAYVRGVG